MLKLIEGPRDAMQGVKELIPTQTKINYINQLLRVAFDTIDFGSFVSPKAIPQMADTHEVIKSRVVAIGPIGYFRRECWPERDDAVYANYLAKMASFIAWLVTEQCAIVFVPGEAHYDQLVIDDLQVALRLRLPNFAQVIIPSVIDSPAALLAQLGQAELLNGSRSHNILLGLQLGKPAIALSYQAKIDALMADVGLADYCLPIGSFDEAALRERFSALYDEAAQRSAVINQRTAQYRAALEQQYERIFKHI